MDDLAAPSVQGLIDEARGRAQLIDESYGDHEWGSPYVGTLLSRLADALSSLRDDSVRLDWLGQSDHTEDIGFDARGAKWVPTLDWFALGLRSRDDLRGRPGFIAFDEDGWPVFDSVRSAIDAARTTEGEPAP